MDRCSLEASLYNDLRQAPYLALLNIDFWSVNKRLVLGAVCASVLMYVGLGCVVMST